MIARGRLWFGTALLLVGLPLPLTLVEAVSFYARNRDTGTLVSSGEPRGYVLYVPRSYDPTRPTPLIISLHAAGLWGAAQEETSRWNRVAVREGVIVVYPSGLGWNGLRVWRVEHGPGLARDVRFIADLIDTLRARYNIDTTRVYANGLSNGGGMSFVLFAGVVRGELGRGGRYRTQSGEAATGFTLYTDTLLRALPRPRPANRLLIDRDLSRGVSANISHSMIFSIG